MERFFRYGLYATVFLTGVAVLIIEVTAVRILTPYFGASLYVLSSVLTVILGALSVGYYVGGKISDRVAIPEPLYGIIAMSGVMVLISAYIGKVALPALNQLFSIISGPLVFGLVLFFVPAFLLGIVSPYVIKLQSLSVRDTEMGSVVGATFFWGTLGSILGSLLTGFFFIPTFGITASVVTTGIVLVSLGLFGMYSMGKCLCALTNIPTTIQKYSYFVLLTLLIATIFFVLIQRDVGTPHLPLTHLYESEGLYSKLIVNEFETQKGTIRTLKQDTNNSSATNMDSYDIFFEYAQFAEFYPLLKPDTKDFFVIGAGSYSIPRTLVAHNPAIEVWVSEIESSLLELSQTYFDLRDVSRIHTSNVDARVFLSRNTDTYDVIFGDAFITDLSIPAHLVSQEFFSEVKQSLAPDGVFMLNSVGRLHGNAPTLIGSLVKTIVDVFPNTEVYVVDKEVKTSEMLQNVMIISRNGTSSIDLSDAFITTQLGERLSVRKMEVSPKDIIHDKDFVFTDDHAPVEYLIMK